MPAAQGVLALFHIPSNEFASHHGDDEEVEERIVRIALGRGGPPLRIPRVRPLFLSFLSPPPPRFLRLSHMPLPRLSHFAAETGRWAIRWMDPANRERALGPGASIFIAQARPQSSLRSPSNSARRAFLTFPTSVLASRSDSRETTVADATEGHHPAHSNSPPQVGKPRLPSSPRSAAPGLLRFLVVQTNSASAQPSASRTPSFLPHWSCCAYCIATAFLSSLPHLRETHGTSRPPSPPPSQSSSDHLAPPITSTPKIENSPTISYPYLPPTSRRLSPAPTHSQSNQTNHRFNFAHAASWFLRPTRLSTRYRGAVVRARQMQETACKACSPATSSARTAFLASAPVAFSLSTPSEPLLPHLYAPNSVRTLPVRTSSTHYAHETI
ncbi:hypothetical protein C8R44DRAFT_981576 [Mycena epipterygia]|nr:hypothetical protein C8R44DRAFT_981576 [Mycena epipterygia]